MVTGSPPASTSYGCGQFDTELCEVLRASLKALADAGEADAACRLAGRACTLLRAHDPAEWAKFNKLLHRLSPMTGDISSPPPG
jgi:hypothetical protein